MMGSATGVPVLRAPMRSRDDAVPVGIAVDRALEHGICGIGGRLVPAPDSLPEAILQTDSTYGERAARRLERFAAVPKASFVWTCDAYEHFWLGRIDGSWTYDTDPAAWAVDLVHVRACRWIPAPIPRDQAPPAVWAAFARGGRNWQRIGDADASQDTALLWSRYDPEATSPVT